MSTFFTALARAEQERAQRHPAVAPPEWTSERSTISSAELLYDYSKFDIGLYTAVVVIFSAALAFAPAGFRFHRGLLSLAVVLTCVAGFAAGVIASRCSYFTSWSGLWRTKIGPFRWWCLRGQYWAYIQHGCFCAALIAAVLSVLSVYVKWPLSLGCLQ
jgi:hypothetical protein